jgi:hypothetical protein
VIHGNVCIGANHVLAGNDVPDVDREGEQRRVSCDARHVCDALHFVTLRMALAASRNVRAFE